MSNNNPISRREALAAGTAFTTSLFTGQVKGANDKIRSDSSASARWDPAIWATR